MIVVIRPLFSALMRASLDKVTITEADWSVPIMQDKDQVVSLTMNGNLQPVVPHRREKEEKKKKSKSCDFALNRSSILLFTELEFFHNGFLSYCNKF